MFETDVLPTKSSITIAVAALNEDENLKQAVRIMVEAAERCFESYEIIIFNDGSTDRTGEVAEALAARYTDVSVVHHERPKCLGGVIRSGLTRARMEYFMWIDGKGATTEQALDSIFAMRGQSDLIVPYPNNQHERSWVRRLISCTFVTVLNVLFQLKLKYYTHVVLCRTDQVRQFTIRTNSYAFQAEMLIKMIKSGCSYSEVGVSDRYEFVGRRTKAFRLNNFTRMGTFLAMTMWDVHIARNYRQTLSSCDQSVPPSKEMAMKE
jgi:glycosyltransferase involved in cell wall biosynthesis